MRKHDEGYSLPLVLIVMVIMCLVSVTIMSVSLHNLQSQKGYIETMQDQYAAQGEIEKAVAQILDGLENPPVDDQSPNTQLSTAQEDVEDIINGYFPSELVTCEGIMWEDDDTCSVTINAVSDSSEVACVIKLDNVISSDYAIKAPDISYEAYTISAVAETVPDASETGVTE